MRSSRLRLIAAALCAISIGCSDDPDSLPQDAGDTSPDAPDVGADAGDAAADADVAADTDASVGPTGPTFALGLDPVQSISQAPFPFNLYLTDDGVRIADLDQDPLLADIASEDLLVMWTERAADRDGFGIGTPMWFFTDEELDPASLEGRVRLIAISGLDRDRELATRTFFDAERGILGVTPAWGEYMVGASTYAVVLERGVATTGGEAYAAPPELTALLNNTVEESPTTRAFAPLTRMLPNSDSLDADNIIAATVFDTEDVEPLGRALITAIDETPVEAPTRNTAWDPDAGAWVAPEPVVGDEALDAFFGVVPDGAANWPARWTSQHYAFAADALGLDADAAPAAPHEGIGAVVHGSIVVPSFHLTAQGEARGIVRDDEGVAISEARSVVPFTLFLCDDMVDASGGLPVIVFSHGGGAQRSNALPIARLGCEAGMATIAIDMIFHSGRFSTVEVEPGLFAPADDDTRNVFTGLEAGDPGFVPDGIGDHASAASSVSKMYAVETMLDPDHITANLLSVTADTWALVRVLDDGDWDAVWPNLSFDTTRLAHVSLSFGTSFHAALLALTDIETAITSVGSGLIFGANLAVAPANGEQGSALIFAALGLQTRPDELQRIGIDDPAMSLLSWLHQGGDPMAWAPHVLRHRSNALSRTLIAFNDSWDDTLSSPAQLSFDAAIGAPAWTFGDRWTLDASIPGAELVDAPPWDGTSTVTLNGLVHTAARFYYDSTCHALLVNNLCVQTWEPEYPPITTLPEQVGTLSPVCEAHTAALAVLRGVLTDTPTLVAPEGDCVSLYGDAE